VNDCWGVPNGTLTPGLNNWGNGTFKLSEDADGLVYRPCIIEVGIPYGVLRPAARFKTHDAGMACEVCATIDGVA